MTPLAYRGFRPTSHYIGFLWRGVALIGVEVAPHAIGIVLLGLWIGVVNDEN